MPVDFSSLVLEPNMSWFGRDVMIDPITSQPGKMPYPAIGIYTSRPVLVQLDNGAVVQSHQTTLGIREIDFAVIPARGDRCTLLPLGAIKGMTMWVSTVTRDGQGGASLELRQELDIEL